MASLAAPRPTVSQICWMRTRIAACGAPKSAAV
jgi:hypothetical protein